MPTYEYKCPKCGTEFEAFQKITSKPVAKCPKCGGRAKRQLSGGAGLVFKGSGFYLTDYGRSGQTRRGEGSESGGADKPAAKDKAAATKPPAKTKSPKKDD